VCKLVGPWIRRSPALDAPEISTLSITGSYSAACRGVVLLQRMYAWSIWFSVPALGNRKRIACLCVFPRWPQARNIWWMGGYTTAVIWLACFLAASRWTAKDLPVKQPPELGVAPIGERPGFDWGRNPGGVQHRCQPRLRLFLRAGRDSTSQPASVRSAAEAGESIPKFHLWPAGHCHFPGRGIVGARLPAFNAFNQRFSGCCFS
jgi:hypothetical protein